MMQVEATLNNQIQFINKFLNNIGGDSKHFINCRSVNFPEYAGVGEIIFIKHNFFSFIISNVILNEDFTFKSLERIQNSSFVDFGMFRDFSTESSFLNKDKKFKLTVPSGEFKHFTMNMPRKMLPQNSNRKEISDLYRRFSSLSVVQSSIKDVFNCNNKNISFALEAESKAIELASQWLRYLQSSTIEEKCFLTKYNEECIRKAKNILDTNFMGTPITIKELSRRVGINELKLKNGFKQLFNITIRQYTILLKMEKAKNLLEKTDMSIGEICSKLGYNHQGHFANIFKRFYGDSPLRYRDQYFF